MRKIAILDDYSDVALASASWEPLKTEFEITVFREHLGDEDSVTQALTGFEVIVAMRERTAFPASLLERLGSLELLVTTGMRNASIDMDAARAAGVTVCGTGMTPHAAYEHTVALIMAIAKNLPASDRYMRDGNWQPAPGIAAQRAAPWA